MDLNETAVQSTQGQLKPCADLVKLVFGCTQWKIHCNESNTKSMTFDMFNVIINLSVRGWSIIPCIQLRQVISDEAVGQVKYYLNQAEYKG